jgi:hypothetical protein
MATNASSRAALAATRLHLRRVDPHRLLHQKRIALTLIQQVVRDPGHLLVPPERHDEVGASSR